MNVVLFATISMVPKDPPHVVGLMLLYVHVNKYGFVQNGIFLRVDYYISLYLPSFWAVIKWGPATVEAGHFPSNFSTE